MNALTKYNALVGELEPFSPSALTIRKALADVGITATDEEYNSTTDSRNIAKAAIVILSKMLVLKSDSLGKSSQSYDADQLKERITNLCEEHGFDVGDYVKVSSITDGSNHW